MKDEKTNIVSSFEKARNIGTLLNIVAAICFLVAYLITENIYLLLPAIILAVSAVALFILLNNSIMKIKSKINRNS